MKLSSREDTNWRRRPGKDDDDSWRLSRHGRGKHIKFIFMS